jgi:hypothetical protein
VGASSVDALSASGPRAMNPKPRVKPRVNLGLSFPGPSGHRKLYGRAAGLSSLKCAKSKYGPPFLRGNKSYPGNPSVSVRWGIRRVPFGPKTYHALRPYTTIIISEDGLIFPFDMAQIAVRKYHHLGEGIDSEEVDRMKKELSEAMKVILEKQTDDSPVYTFTKDLKPPMLTVAEAVASAAGDPFPLQPRRLCSAICLDRQTLQP